MRGSEPEWADSDDHATLEEVFTSRSFGHPLPEAPAPAVVPEAVGTAVPYFVQQSASSRRAAAAAAALSVVAGLTIGAVRRVNPCSPRTLPDRMFRTSVAPRPPRKVLRARRRDRRPRSAPEPAISPAVCHRSPTGRRRRRPSTPLPRLHKSPQSGGSTPATLTVVPTGSSVPPASGTSTPAPSSTTTPTTPTTTTTPTTPTPPTTTTHDSRLVSYWWRSPRGWRWRQRDRLRWNGDYRDRHDRHRQHRQLRQWR